MIDITFDFNSDAGGGDPDSQSPTLRKYHQLLWSKKLPCGDVFDLQMSVKGSYLHFTSPTGNISLSSDSIGHSYKNVAKMKSILEKVPVSDVERFWKLNSTIGGYILFPGKKIDGNMTINQMRGVSHRIGDRFDLTLECIRRFYVGEESPLTATLERYGGFFALFESFQGYVNFFLLNDLVDSSYKRVIYFTPFDELFSSSPLPQDVDAYLLYRGNVMDFIRGRNQRILNWANNHQ
jgi:hypothetical protein